jgi:hypothetical protein
MSDRLGDGGQRPTLQAFRLSQLKSSFAAISCLSQGFYVFRIFRKHFAWLGWFAKVGAGEVFDLQGFSNTIINQAHNEITVAPPPMSHWGGRIGDAGIPSSNLK